MTRPNASHVINTRTGESAKPVVEKLANDRFHLKAEFEHGEIFHHDGEKAFAALPVHHLHVVSAGGDARERVARLRAVSKIKSHGRVGNLD